MNRNHSPNIVRVCVCVYESVPFVSRAVNKISKRLKIYILASGIVSDKDGIDIDWAT